MRFAGVVAIDLAAIRRDLDRMTVTLRAHRPELCPHLIDHVGPGAQQLGDTRGSGARGEVVVVVLGPLQERIADRAADQEDLFTGGGEDLGQLSRGQIGSGEELEPLGDHRAAGYR